MAVLVCGSSMRQKFVPSLQGVVLGFDTSMMNTEGLPVAEAEPSAL